MSYDVYKTFRDGVLHSLSGYASTPIQSAMQVSAKGPLEASQQSSDFGGYLNLYFLSLQSTLYQIYYECIRVCRIRIFPNLRPYG